jgi:hypothetical protein
MHSAELAHERPGVGFGMDALGADDDAEDGWGWRRRAEEKSTRVLGWSVRAWISVAWTWPSTRSSAAHRR